MHRNYGGISYKYWGYYATGGCIRIQYWGIRYLAGEFWGVLGPCNTERSGSEGSDSGSSQHALVRIPPTATLHHGMRRMLMVHTDVRPLAALFELTRLLRAVAGVFTTLDGLSGLGSPTICLRFSSSCSTSESTTRCSNNRTNTRCSNSRSKNSLSNNRRNAADGRHCP